MTLFRGNANLPFSAEAALAHVTAKDRPLARTIERVGAFGLKLHDSRTPFETLAESILHQQITGKAAAAIAARLCASFGGESYPAPELVVRARTTKLRSAGLSATKAAAIKDLAAKVLDGTVPTFEAMGAMSDDEIVERLVDVRGIGRWTAEMLLIFRLGRPDVLPSTDYGIRKGFARVYRAKDLPAPKEILTRGERWRPFRTLASWYLWRCLELPP
jgi:DNA-3-methyladenine glycosylase II